MSKVIVKANKVSKIYTVGETKITALNDLSFEINEGEFTVILGPSGAGKTTLLNLVGGMDTITSGDLLVNNTNIKGLTERELTSYRRNDVGFVFQFYNLMPNLTALENIELSSEICKNAFDSREILEQVGLKDRANNFPAQLSGGEQQRVSIARALAKNPSILLCDEPTGALDYQTGKAILKLLYQMAKKNNKTIIVVTHNQALKDMADKVVNIKNGTVTSVVINENPKDIMEIEW